MTSRWPGASSSRCGTRPGTPCRGALSDVRIHQTGDEFRITFVSSHEAGELCFIWKGIIGGTADGSCSFSMDGSAVTSFPYRRIGICVLHPPGEFAGQGFSATGGGAAISGQLPALVAPPGPSAGIDEPLIPAFARLALSGRHVVRRVQLHRRSLRDRGSAQLDGCLVQVVQPTARRQRRAGTSRRRKAAPAGRLRIGHCAGPHTADQAPAVPQIVIGDEMAASMPEVGLAHADDLPPPAPRHRGAAGTDGAGSSEGRCARAAEGWAQRLGRARLQAQELGCPLEIAVFLENGAYRGSGAAGLGARAGPGPPGPGLPGGC